VIPDTGFSFLTVSTILLLSLLARTAFCRSEDKKRSRGSCITSREMKPSSVVTRKMIHHRYKRVKRAQPCPFPLTHVYFLLSSISKGQHLQYAWVHSVLRALLGCSEKMPLPRLSPLFSDCK